MADTKAEFLDVPVQTRKLFSALAFSAMIVGVLITYASPQVFTGHWRLEGLDYTMLHQRRIDFALEQIAAHRTVPAWYPREQFGVPFWSNVQSFPLIPTRLALLPTGADNLFTLAVNFSAILAAAFTFLFARRIGVGAAGAAVAGYTFACCGFFASRVLAGQLGMIEAYPALPVLLYLVERVRAAPTGRSLAGWTAILAFACGSFSLSAHPQLAIYSLAAAAVYVLFRCELRRMVPAGLAMMLGIGMAAFQLYPMTRLIARSSRVLPMDAPSNDFVLPYARLVSMIFPWRDGAPQQVRRPGGVGDFSRDYPFDATFWDTVNYVGWLPIIAAITLAGWCAWRRRWPGRAALFLAMMVVFGFVLALPLARDALPATPFVVLRSPARLMYLVSFALSLAAGALVCLLAAAPRWTRTIALVTTLLVAGHALDLWRHARCFVSPSAGLLGFKPEQEAQLRQIVGDGRAAIDMNMNLSINRRIDDLGFFDSIMLAGTYRGFTDLAGISERINVQEMDGGHLPTHALKACGVRLVMTAVRRPDPPAQRGNNYGMYIFEDSAARVAWFGRSIRRMTPIETSLAMRSRSVDLRQTLLIPPDAPKVSEEGTTPRMLEPLTIRHRRPSPDRLEIPVDIPEPGYVRVLESFDMGWSATVDGAAAPVIPAHNMAMAVPVPAGRHEVVLEFRTPGRRAGLWISLTSLGLLVCACGFAARFPPARGRIAESAG